MERLVVLALEDDQGGAPVHEHEREIQGLVEDGTTVVVAPSVEAARVWLGQGPKSEQDGQPVAVVEVGNLNLDLGAHRVTCLGRRLNLTEHEVQILAALTEDIGRAWSFRDLTRKVWETEYYADPSPVRCAVQRLRKKLAGAGASVRIEAVRGVGFRLAVGARP